MAWFLGVGGRTAGGRPSSKAANIAFRYVNSKGEVPKFIHQWEKLQDIFPFFFFFFPSPL